MLDILWVVLARRLHHWHHQPTEAEVSDEPYTEHAKLAKISDKSQVIGAFLEWLPHGGYVLARNEPDGIIPTWDIQGVLAKYFGIDQDKLENEKRAMLDRQRLINEGLVES